MAKYLAGVLSVIAVGTLLIAYGLLNPRVATADGSARMQVIDRGGADLYAPTTLPPAAYQATVPRGFQPVSIVEDAPAARRAVVTRPVSYEREVQERPARVTRRAPERDWKKTAMIIGGSSAAGAGLGAILGGKKGALIGAAIGGGASTIYETQKR